MNTYDPKTWQPGSEGIFFDMPEHIYRSAPGVNFSNLKHMTYSPKKYKHALENPKERTPAMAFGTITHAMCLEPAKVPELIVTRPDKWDSFRTKEAREWRDAQTALVVTKETLEEIEAAANAVRNHPAAGWILKRAKKEVAVFKRHERTGLLLKARLDLPFEDMNGDTAVADIKKVQSVRPGLFAKAIGEFLYHLQGAFYVDILGASSFYFLCVEEAAPHEVDIFQLSPESLARGRAVNERLLDDLCRCKKEDRWPGISEDSTKIKIIEEPVWAQNNLVDPLDAVAA